MRTLKLAYLQHLFCEQTVQELLQTGCSKTLNFTKFCYLVIMTLNEGQGHQTGHQNVKLGGPDHTTFKRHQSLSDYKHVQGVFVFNETTQVGFSPLNIKW